MKNISPKEACELIKNKEFIILDVRTPEEYQQNHLEGAINIDIYMKTFEEELKKLDKNKSYLIHCHSGGRSENAGEIMEELGFKYITNVIGFLFPHLE